MPPDISSHFLNRAPSPIREAQILFAQRGDKSEVDVLNVAIGNVSLPMHPAMIARLKDLGHGTFGDGVVKYTPTVGTDEARRACLHIIASAGIDTKGLDCVVTDGGSQAMELMVLATCGPRSERPLMVLDPSYTNYVDMARRCGVKTVSAARTQQADGTYDHIDPAAIEKRLKDTNAAALVVIPSDNPTGQFITQEQLTELARACVKAGVWIVCDEAYRQLQYNTDSPSSVWRITEKEVPGITGSRLGIESASKVWNACGLRVGALVTDNPTLHQKTVAEYTANLSGNALGQHIYAALAHETFEDLNGWYSRQRDYYRSIMATVAEGFHKELPGIVVAAPEASVYTVIDVAPLVDDKFSAAQFVRYCSQEGRVEVAGKQRTVLVSPMGGFFAEPGDSNRGRTQMRLAFVETPDRMALIPPVFAALFRAYHNR